MIPSRMTALILMLNFFANFSAVFLDVSSIVIVIGFWIFIGFSPFLYVKDTYIIFIHNRFVNTFYFWYNIFRFDRTYSIRTGRMYVYEASF